MSAKASGARPSDPAKPVKKAAPSPQVTAEPPPTPAPTEPAAHRAGGWIDRGDGRGWELEE